MKKKIAMAWRADTEKKSYQNFVTTVNEVGGEPVLLDQVVDYDLKYLDGRISDEGVDENEYLSQEYANIVKKNTYHNSNVEAVIKDFDAVIFTGGEDISPTLTNVVEDWHGNQYEKNYNPTRDVSDYLLLSYCLDNDIPVLCICRGMQMLAMISGAEMIQDLPILYEKLGLEYNFEHRNHQKADGGYRDYASHDVNIIDKESIMYDIYKCEELENIPSWHHQAVKSVEGTPLKVTAITNTCGYDVIEAIERTDKNFVLGIQAHPEASVYKHINNIENADNYMDKDTAIKAFAYFLEKVSR